VDALHRDTQKNLDLKLNCIKT